jgi:hypothetical protein
MLGWHISVYRQPDGGSTPAATQSPKGTRLAVWQTGLGGLDWLDALVKSGQAVDLGGSGYPCRYTAPAENLIPHIIETPPGARAVWITGAGDTVTDKWDGQTVIDRAAADACRPDEWLLVEAWDES